jgi:hypothetical protein
MKCEWFSLLDPLLDLLARKYIDDSDLSTRLRTLFKVYKIPILFRKSLVQNAVVIRNVSVVRAIIILKQDKSICISVHDIIVLCLGV